VTDTTYTAAGYAGLLGLYPSTSTTGLHCTGISVPGVLAGSVFRGGQAKLQASATLQAGPGLIQPGKASPWQGPPLFGPWRA
jgi:hypothetical protein